MMRGSRSVRSGGSGSGGSRGKGGGNPLGLIILVLWLLTLVSLVGMPYTVLMPIFAGSILHGGPHTLGFLMAAAGLGALTGAITLAMRRSVLGLGKIIIWSASLFGVG